MGVITLSGVVRRILFLHLLSKLTLWGMGTLPKPQGDPYSNTYNLGCRSQSNVSSSNQGIQKFDSQNDNFDE